MIFALAVTAAALLAITISASSASAAFTPTTFSATPTNLQAAGHGNLDIKIGLDALSADQSGDDLSTLQIELPSGQLFNPQAVASSCTATLLRADRCPAASLLGTITVKFRMYGSIRSAAGSVYMLPASADSPLNFGFVVRPSGLQKLFFQSSKVTGMTTVRQGLDADYGLTITIPQIPRYVKDGFGFQYAMTISEIAFSLNSKAPSGKYFVFNPTRCDASTAQATLTSVRGAAPALTSSYVATGCSAVPFDPYVLVQPTSSIADAPTGVKATFSIDTADAAVQRSHMNTIAATFPGGTLVDMDTLMAIGVCTDAELAAAACPANSQIGTANVDVPLLSAPMTGGIFLTSRSGGVHFAVVITGPNGTNAVFRGRAELASGGIRATFTALPQAPYRSAILEFTSKILVNPAKSCPTTFTQIDALGYSGMPAAIASMVNLTGCVPDTTLTAAPPALTRTKQPSFSFTSDMSNATFKCRMDAGTWDPCVSPYISPTSLAEGLHKFDVRAFYGAEGDPTPETTSFTIDSVPPVVNVTSPVQGATIYGDSITLEWTSPDGVSAYCSLSMIDLETCASGKTYSNLAPGTYNVFFSVRDEAGNYKPTFLHVTIAPPPDPVVSISKPIDGETTELDGPEIVFTATSPNGTEIIATTCRFESESAPDQWYTVRSFPCESGDKVFGLTTGARLRLAVTATDVYGLEGVAHAIFVVGARNPLARSVINGPRNVATDDRTPTFPLTPGTDPQYPDKVDECAFYRPTDTSPNWMMCSPTEDSYTSPTELADGDWIFAVRARSGTRLSTVSKTNFEVSPWAPTYTATPSTSAAGGHPDLDVDIIVPSGQLRKVDMTLPRGLIGSLNSAAQCPLENVPTPRMCAADTKIGEVEVELTVFGLHLTPLPGTVFLTEPQVPGDAAGLVILVPKPLNGYEDVVIPLQLQLLQNAGYMRVFSDSIPTQVMRTGHGLADYFVHDFKMHVDGSKGSPFPLLWNPTNCSAGNFSTVIGSLVGAQTDALARPFQATGCAALPFAPAYAQSISSTTAGQLTGLTADITVPTGNSALRRAKVVQPPSLKVNTPALGTDADQCPSSSTKSDGTFDPAGCPTAALVGSVSITSPLLPRAVEGTVHLVSASPLPSFGVYVNDTELGVKLGFFGTNTTPVDDSCDPDVTGFCDAQITTQFQTLPDVPASTIHMVIDGPTRVTASGATLDGRLLKVANPEDRICFPSSEGYATFTPHSATAAVKRAIPLEITGCPTG